MFPSKKSKQSQTASTPESEAPQFNVTPDDSSEKPSRLISRHPVRALTILAVIFLVIGAAAYAYVQQGNDSIQTDDLDQSPEITNLEPIDTSLIEKNIQEASKAVDKDPDNTQLIINLAQLHATNNDTSRAIELYERALKVADTKAEGYELTKKYINAEISNLKKQEQSR